MSEKNKNESNKKSSNSLYKVERVCGNGSFGIIFQAKVIQTGEVVAIKKYIKIEDIKTENIL